MVQGPKKEWLPNIELFPSPGNRFKCCSMIPLVVGPLSHSNAQLQLTIAPYDAMVCLQSF